MQKGLTASPHDCTLDHSHEFTTDLTGSAGLFGLGSQGGSRLRQRVTVHEAHLLRQRTRLPQGSSLYRHSLRGCLPTPVRVVGNRASAEQWLSGSDERLSAKGAGRFWVQLAQRTSAVVLSDCGCGAYVSAFSEAQFGEKMISVSV